MFASVAVFCSLHRFKIDCVDFTGAFVPLRFSFGLQALNNSIRAASTMFFASASVVPCAFTPALQDGDYEIVVWVEDCYHFVSVYYVPSIISALPSSSLSACAAFNQTLQSVLDVITVQDYARVLFDLSALVELVWPSSADVSFSAQCQVSGTQEAQYSAEFLHLLDLMTMNSSNLPSSSIVAILQIIIEHSAPFASEEKETAIFQKILGSLLVCGRESALTAATADGMCASYASSSSDNLRLLLTFFLFFVLCLSLSSLSCFVFVFVCVSFAVVCLSFRFSSVVASYVMHAVRSTFFDSCCIL